MLQARAMEKNSVSK